MWCGVLYFPTINNDYLNAEHWQREIIFRLESWDTVYLAVYRHGQSMSTTEHQSNMLFAIAPSFWTVFLVIGLLSRRAEAQEGLCDSMGLQGWNYFDGNCYTFQGQALSWQEASRACQDTFSTAHLAVPNSAQENSYIAGLMPPGSSKIWLGCHAIGADGLWTCLDQSGKTYNQGTRTPSLNSYWNWLPGQPQDNIEECAVLVKEHSNQWHDFSCSRHTFPGICEVQVGVCDADPTCDGRYGCHYWPRTIAGTASVSNVTCDIHTSKAGQPVASRYCGFSPEQSIWDWRQIEYIDCDEQVALAEGNNTAGLSSVKICAANTTCDEKYGCHYWPQTRVGTASVSNVTCDSSTSKAGQPVAYRYCGFSLDQSVWNWHPIGYIVCDEATAPGEKTNNTSGCEKVFQTTASPVTTPIAEVNSCPPDWKPHDNYCYYVNTTNKGSFSAATVTCQRMGSNLTSIHSLAEQRYHSMLAGEAREDLWIGLHDVSNRGNFEWTDETLVNFQSWNSMQIAGLPSIEGCGYLLYTASGQWDRRRCSDSLGFICKKPRVVRDGFCPHDVTYGANGPMTWPETPIGKTALSEETCGANTDNSGRSISGRFCSPVFEKCTPDMTNLHRGQVITGGFVDYRSANSKIRYGRRFEWGLDSGTASVIFAGYCSDDRGFGSCYLNIVVSTEPAIDHYEIVGSYLIFSNGDKVPVWDTHNVDERQIDVDVMKGEFFYNPHSPTQYRSANLHFIMKKASTQPQWHAFSVQRCRKSRPTECQNEDVRIGTKNETLSRFLLASSLCWSPNYGGGTIGYFYVWKQASATAENTKCAAGMGKGKWGPAELMPCNNVVQEYLPVMCRSPMGMEDGTIIDNQITASSQYSPHHAPSQARLNLLSNGVDVGCWSVSSTNQNQWIQVDLLHRKTISGVVLQGRDRGTRCDNCLQYVTEFMVLYGQDGIKWNYVKDTERNDEIFEGNMDRTTPVTRYFRTPIAARFVRIRPWAWRGHISLRFELLGCNDCPHGWDVNGEYCYYISSDQHTFADARVICEHMDSNLTSIHSDDEQTYHALQAQTVNEPVWIGLHDRTNERRFIWIDGSETVNFEPQWAPNQPDNWAQDGEDCVHLSTGKNAGLWADLPCTSLARYMCKKPKARRLGMCPAMVTSHGSKRLTWENVLAGDIGYSDEVCPYDSVNSGLPLATRICRQTTEWGSVQMFNCNNDMQSTVPTVTFHPDCQTYHTPNDFDVSNPGAYDHHYYWPQIPSDVTYFTFKVRASNDVRLSLSSEYGDVQDMYRIVLGGWGNTKSTIRPCKDCSSGGPYFYPPPVPTPALLSPDEYREFYVSFDNGNVRVGRVSEDPLLTYQSDAIYQVKYVGIGTGRGSTGDWIFCGFSSETQDCPMDWELNGDYCYYVAMSLLSFSQAENECEKMDAKLTSINNEQEQLYHTALAKRIGMHLWLGLHDRTDENNFVWVDGSPYEGNGNWAPNQPDNNGYVVGEDCVQMQTGDDAGLWNDAPCSRNTGYICKQPKAATCGKEQTHSEYGVLNWSKTMVGDATFSAEICPENTEHHGVPIAFRRCVQDYLAASSIDQGIWQPVKMLGCHGNTNNSTGPQLTDDDVEAVAGKLEHYIKAMGYANSKDVHTVAWMIKDIANANSNSTMVLESMVQAISTLVKTMDPSLGTRQRDDLSASTSDIVRALEKQVTQTLKQQNELKILESSLAVVGVKISNEEINPLRFSTYYTGIQNERAEFLDATLANMNEISGESGQLSVASIHIPSSAFLLGKGGSNYTKLGFIAYSNDFLFRSSRLESEMLMVDGPIVATTLTASNLPEPVIIQIKRQPDISADVSNDVVPTEELPSHSSRRCVFWDFQLQNGAGEWSEEGCQLIEATNKMTTCHCTHLSTFTVLRVVTTSETEKLKLESRFALTAGTKFAIVLTLLAVFFTLFVLIGSKTLRESKTYSTICNFSGAVFILFIVFAAGIDATYASVGCIVIACLMHYFTLVSLLWLAAEIRFTYTDCQAPEGAPSSHVQPRSLLKAYVVSWGIPAVVIGLTMAISFDDYKNPQFCAVTVSPALFYGAVIPLTAIVLHNVATFAAAFYALRNRRSREEMNADDYPKVHRSAQRLSAALGVSIVFTVSLCLMYLFLTDPSNSAIRALFGLSMASLGFAIFGMFVIYQDEVRDVIVSKFCKGSSEILSSSFGNLAYHRQESKDVENVEIANILTT